MLTVHSPTPLYWKTSVLDRFDGFAWQRAKSSDPLATVERQARYATPKGVLRGRHPEWITTVRFQVDGLRSQFVTATGTAIATRGLSAPNRSADGTVTNLGGPLISGAEYSVTSYVPRPDARRAARGARPHTRSSGSARPPWSGSRTRSTPGTGSRCRSGGPTTTRRSSGSSTRPTRRPTGSRGDWTAGATTPYAAVRAIEDHLRSDYTYDPNVISHTYPLGSFLFDDRAGYCQQFAGAMGLMLRMMGIPSRVVAGFAPGTRHSDDGTFQVRDLDAHSWVEAYFRGIGWVTFDPTPAAAPAGSQSQHGELAGTRGPAPDPQLDPSSVKGGADQSTVDRRRGELRLGRRAAVGRGSGWCWRSRSPGSSPASWSSTAVAARSRPASWPTSRSASCAGRSSGSAGSWTQTSPCSALERRYSAAGRGPLRRYLRMLREHRYAAETTPPPGPADRRALRSAISSGSLRRRLQGLLAIPPGGPSTAPVSEPSPFSAAEVAPGVWRWTADHPDWSPDAAAG